MDIDTQLREEKRNALLNGDRAKVSIISTVLGEIENSRARKNWEDGGEAGIVRKMVESNRETIKLCKDSSKTDELKYEIEVLKRFLPQELSLKELASQLTLVSTDILATGSFGRGMGIAMEFVKEKNLNVSGKLVHECVKRIFNV